MKHGIGSNGVNLRVTPSVGVHCTGEVGLLVQDVIPLQHDGERLAAQETVAQLCIPNEFVGIQRLVAVASFAEHMGIGREIATPRECDSGIAAIGEIPGCQVVGSLKTVLSMCIGSSSVKREIEPLVAETERH